MDKHVTVVIPAFNAIHFLSQAIASVQRQQYADLDIVVIDDGSTDGTTELARGLPGVQCIRQDQAGPAAARNRGIQAARGELLAFLDADDLWSDGKLTAQLTVLEGEPAIDLVAGRVEEFYQDSVPHDNTRSERQSGDRAYTVGALMIRRNTFDKVGLFDPELRFGEFIDWRSRAMALGMRERVLDQVVLRRRIHARNTTRVAQDHKQYYLATIRAHLQRQRPAPGKPGAAS